jgi:hypothetical protein
MIVNDSLSRDLSGFGIFCKYKKNGVIAVFSIAYRKGSYDDYLAEKRPVKSFFYYFIERR